MVDTLQDLERRINVVEEEIAVIRAKVENAKAQRQATGVYADPVWFAKAKAALRFKGMEHQRLLRQAARLRQAQRSATAATIECAFVAVARRELPKATFDSLMAQAVIESPMPRG